MPWKLPGLAVMAVFVVFSASAQTDRGAIRGSVLDPSGLGVPNAEVQARNQDTSVIARETTNAQGGFTFAALKPGVYEVTATMTGFKRAVAAGVVVSIGETVRVDIPFEIGNISERIDVAGAASLVTPDKAEAGTVLTAKEYDTLPLAAVSRVRIPTDFALLTPGVLGGQQRPGSAQTATTSLSLDGSADAQTDILIDGMSAGQFQNFGSFTEMGTPVDAIAEFNIIKGSFSAEYGMVRTGLVSFSLKSGTNQFHGSVFENFRNRALNARAFFEQEKLPFQQNNFGGTLLGPVWLPKIYKGTNRTFFMVSSDNSIFRGASQIVVYTTPTLDFLKGNFSALRNANGTARPIYDPSTGVTDGRGGVTREPFAGNMIPPSRISGKVAALYPAPNLPGTDSNLTRTPSSTTASMRSTASPDRPTTRSFPARPTTIPTITRRCSPVCPRISPATNTGSLTITSSRRASSTTPSSAITAFSILCGPTAWARTGRTASASRESAATAACPSSVSPPTTTRRSPAFAGTAT